MNTTTVSAAKITDHHGRCRDCGAALTRPETIITYWNAASADGMSGTHVSEKGIGKIDVNAGLCEACQVKKLRKELERKRDAAAKQETNAPGTGAVAMCAVGIFVAVLALGIKATRVDEFGQSMPYITTWFYIWAALGLVSIIGLPIAIARKKRLCSGTLSTIGEDLKLDDGALLSKYRLMEGVPYMKWAWSDYMVTQFKRRQGGLAYASELLQMGSPEAVAKELGLPRELAAYLLDAAQQCAGTKG